MDSPSENRPSRVKDRNARGQGQGPRTQAPVFSKKKKIFKKNFSGDLRKTSLQKVFQAIYKILTIQKIVLSSSRGQGNFRGLKAFKPKPRSSKCVLVVVVVLSDPFRGMGAWRNSAETQQSCHTPRSGP